jgi:catechol 2,3-dioxygenase-like lactoylglutathione lyase family enzyme
MIKTYGLTHLALAVRDAARAARFYTQVFGAVVVYKGAGFVQLQTPGMRDVLVLEERDRAKAGTSGGIAHFGFRLQNPGDVNAAARAIERAGGTIREQGEFVPGEPYIFARDLDGYEIEVWYEIPTRVDPRPPRRKRSATVRPSTRRPLKAARD